MREIDKYRKYSTALWLTSPGFARSAHRGRIKFLIKGIFNQVQRCSEPTHDQVAELSASMRGRPVMHGRRCLAHPGSHQLAVRMHIMRIIDGIACARIDNALRRELASIPGSFPPRVQSKGTEAEKSSLVPRPSASSAPCALRVIIKCGGGKTEAEGLEEFIT